jgi:putative transposase
MQLWQIDIVYGAKLYLAVVVDCFSRRCVGWAMAEHMRAELVAALEMALWRRRPAVGLVHHLDLAQRAGSLKRLLHT